MNNLLRCIISDQILIFSKRQDCKNKFLANVI